MQTTATLGDVWAVPSSVSANARIFRWLLGFGFCISGVVLVEPAPVDALMAFLLVFGILIGTVRLAAVPVLPALLLVGLALANLVSVTFAPDLPRGIWYIFVTFYMLASWVLFVGALDMGGKPLLQTIFRGYSFAACFSVLLAIASYFHVIGFQTELLRFGRPKGLFKDPNVFGPFLVPIAIMAITGCLPIASRLWQASIAVVTSMGIVLSYSRGAWVNYAISLMLFIALDIVLPSKTPERHSVPLKRWVLFGGIAVMTIVVLLQVPSVQRMLALRIGQNGVQNYDRTRFQTQHLALLSAIDRPLGLGPGQSAAAFRYPPHSSYMRVLSENGLFGLSCFVAFLLCSTAQAARKACLAPTVRWRGFFIATAACLCGQIVNSGVLDTVHWRHLWFLLALPWISARVWQTQAQEDGHARGR